MATILRSSKYIRCLNVFTRRIVVSNDNSTFVKKSLELQALCANSYLTKKSYATIPAIERNDNVPNFDRTFVKLDENIQRFGRVFKFEIDGMLSKVRELGNMSSLDALLLIRCCGDLMGDTVPKDRSALVEEIWSTLDILKIPIDVSHFNALLRVHLDNNYEFSTITFLTTMKDKKVEPNRVTYQRLMLYHCKKGDIDGATKILEFMREKGIPLSESVFSALITGHSEANDLDSAKNVMHVMEEAGVDASSCTYTALLSAYAKRGDMESIRQTISEIGMKNQYLQDTDMFEVVQVLAANGHTDNVDEILSIVPNGPNYNLNASHAILKLLDVGNIDVALKILATMNARKKNETDEVEIDSGIFLIRKLVNGKYPVSKIIDACEKLQQEGMNQRAFVTAVERSLVNADKELSMPLLEAWKKNGGDVREHYFWPILILHGRASNYQGILDVVSAMISTFKITPTFETIKDYILPYTVGRWDNIVVSTRDFGIPHETVITAIATRMLTDHKIRKAATFMLNYPSKYNNEHFHQPLAEAFKATNDSRSFAIILRLMCDSLLANGEKSPLINDGPPSITDIVDVQIGLLLNYYIPNDKYALVEKVLDELINVGLSVSAKMGQLIREYFNENMNSLMDERIEKLTSGTLTPVTILELSTSLVSGDSDPFNMLRSYSRTERNFGVKRRELGIAIQQEDITTVETIIQEIEALRFKFSPAAYAQIIDLYCTKDDMENAEKWMNRCKSEYPEVSLDLQKTTKYAGILIQNDRFDDAIKFILESPRKPNPEAYVPGLRKLVKGLLDIGAGTGNVEKTGELFEALLKSNYMLVDNFLLGPLVKVHMVRNDTEGALAAYEHLCQTYRCTPMRNELSKKLIAAEDANALQRLTDLSTQIHGESNSLIDLVISFIECERLRQARKILETPGLRIRGRKLRTTVERYVEDDENYYLEQFTDITKGLSVIDRQEFYDALMEAYYKRNNWQRGLNLWTTIQDEDVQPSDIFLTTLAELLKRNGQSVPFTYNMNVNPDAPEQQYMEDISRAIKANNLTTAENILNSLPPNHTDYTSGMSELVIAYTNQQNLDKAWALAEGIIFKHGRMPRTHALKTLWNAFIMAGEYAKLRIHGDRLSTDIKTRLRFSKYLNRAYLKEVGLRKFLAEFEAKLDSSKNNKIQIVREGLHFDTLVQEFKNDPSSVDKFHILAEKLIADEIYSPINLLWCYYFQQNKPEADDIWSKYLEKTGRVMFNYLFQQSKKENNVELAERLFEKISSTKEIPENSKIFALTNLVEVYTQNRLYEKALKVIEGQTPSTIKLWNKLYPIAAKNYKEGLQSSGKSFPFMIDDTRTDEQ